MTCGLYLWPSFLWWFCVHWCGCVPMPSHPLHLLALRFSDIFKDDPWVVWLSLWEEVKGTGNNPTNKHSSHIPVMGTVSAQVTQTGVHKTAAAMPGCVLCGAAVVTFLFVCLLLFCSVIFLRPQLGRHECLELTGTVGNSNFSRPLLS